MVRAAGVAAFGLSRVGVAGGNRADGLVVGVHLRGLQLALVKRGLRAGAFAEAEHSRQVTRVPRRAVREDAAGLVAKRAAHDVRRLVIVPEPVAAHGAPHRGRVIAIRIGREDLQRTRRE
jgi:hypothetical protein